MPVGHGLRLWHLMGLVAVAAVGCWLAVDSPLTLGEIFAPVTLGVLFAAWVTLVAAAECLVLQTGWRWSRRFGQASGREPGLIAFLSGVGIMLLTLLAALLVPILLAALLVPILGASVLVGFFKRLVD